MMATLNQPFSDKPMAPFSGQDFYAETLQVKASQTGDTAAFNQLVLRWERPIFGLACRMLQNQEEAREATQEIFISAYRSIHRFRLGARFSTWIFRIASNHCISQLRRRPRGHHLSMFHPGEDAEFLPLRQLHIEPTHDTDLIQGENRQQVLQALGRLNQEQRLVIELKFYQDCTFEEISEIADCPLSTVKSRFYAGLTVLKRLLSGDDTRPRAMEEPS